ncbi:MAG TPA: YlxR family protein [Candidatus Eisenbacteria bacterium]|nr:YlxR family protein [Candidatus Eisenbacteria bacterium]
MACRTSRTKRELLRVVRTPAGEVRVDESGRANGRGAYICRDQACISTAIDRGALARALETRVPAELKAELERAAGTTESITTPGGPHGQE